jgi:glycosyltransferase involved in cell wall biosynthesis
MAAGLPAVCFNTIPHEDIFVSPKMGVVSSDLSSQSLAKAIDRLISDEAHRTTLGNNASKIKEHLDIQRIGSQYLDFMQLSTC